MIRLGKAMPGNNRIGDAEAIIAGISQYVISIDVLREIFEKDAKLRENTIIIVSNKSTDGDSGIRKHEDLFISNSQPPFNQKDKKYRVQLSYNTKP